MKKCLNLKSNADDQIANNLLGRHERTRLFIVLVISAAIGSFLYTALATALPSIMIEFKVSSSAAQWLTSAFALTMGIMLPITPFFVKRFQTSQLFIVGMAVFMTGLLCSAVAHSFELLIIGRILQALGCGLFSSLAQILIYTIYPADQRGRMMGVLGFALGVTPIIAPTLTGILIDTMNWRYIFWIAIIILLLVTIFGFKSVKNVSEVQNVRLDLLSVLLSSIGLGGILFGVGNIGNTSISVFALLVSIIIGLCLLIIYTVRQLKIVQPILELRVLRNYNARNAIIISSILYAILIVGSTLLPIYIQTLRGLSATISGLVVLPGSLAMALLNPIAGNIYDKHGFKTMATVGSIFFMISCCLFAVIGKNTSLLFIILVFVIRSASASMIFMPVVNWGLKTIQNDYIADTIALINTVRTIVSSIAVAFFVAIMNGVPMIINIPNLIKTDYLGMNVAFTGIAMLATILTGIVIITVRDINTVTSKF